MVDPTSPIAVNAMGRAMDIKRAIPAFFGAVRTGIEGVDTTNFDGSGRQDVALGVGDPAADQQVLNILHLARAGNHCRTLKMLQKADVRPHFTG